MSVFLNPRRIARPCIIIKPSTLLKFHAGLVKRKYRFGYPRISQQINLAFDLELDKDTASRVLATLYKPDPCNRGPSWLTTIGHAKDSSWSIDRFRCESILLKSHWVMIVMDQYTRRIIGFGVHAGNVDEIKSVPHVSMSHRFVERLIGSIRRELLNHVMFWTATDLEIKLREYQCYYNENRTHTGRNGGTPIEATGSKAVDINKYQWEKHCRGLFELPAAA